MSSTFFMWSLLDTTERHELTWVKGAEMKTWMIKRWKTGPFKNVLNIKVSIWSWSLLPPYSWLSIWCEVFDSGLHFSSFSLVSSLYSDGHFTFLTMMFHFCSHLIWSLLSSKFTENAEILLAHWIYFIHSSSWLIPIYLIQSHFNLLLSRSSKMKTWS